MSVRLSCLTCVLVASVILLGCGSSSDVLTGTVSGTVSYEGKTLSEGMVELWQPDSGDAKTAKIDSSGKFVIEEPIPVGEYIAIISPPELTAAPGEGGEAEPELGKFPNIPMAYRSPETSDLTVKIEEGENTVKLEMTKNGGKKPEGEQAP